MSKTIYHHKKPLKPAFHKESIHICEYGCNRPAHYQFKNKRWCCSTISNKCPAKISRFKETGNQVAENGLTQFQNRAILSTESQRNDIDETGLNGLQRKARKAIETQRLTIEENGKSQLENKLIQQRISAEPAMRRSVEQRKNIDENGLNAYQRHNLRAAKNAKNNIQENGLSSFENGQMKRQEKLSEIDENGKSGWQKIHLKAHKTLSTVDENGEDGYDKSFRTARRVKDHPKLDIYYQASYEKDFLDEMIGRYGVKWCQDNIKRGPNTKYICPISGRERLYKPDFLIEGTIYEIKSKWSWDHRGMNPEAAKINAAKLDTMKENGYKVILVLEHQEIIW